MVSVMNGNKDVPHGHGGVMGGGGGKINSIIRLTHLLLQRLRRAPSPRLLHTIITRLFASAAACDEDNGKGCECEREKICPPPVSVSEARIFYSYLLLVHGPCALRIHDAKVRSAHCQRVTRQPPGYASVLDSASDIRQHPNLETIN